METKIILAKTVRFDKGQLQVILLPELPTEGIYDWVDAAFAEREYDEAVAYARAHPIDVPSEIDKEKIEKLVYDKENPMAHNSLWEPQEHTEYKLEGVRMEIKETCVANGERLSCANETCWDLNECQHSPSKQIAVLLND